MVFTKRLRAGVRRRDPSGSRWRSATTRAGTRRVCVLQFCSSCDRQVFFFPRSVRHLGPIVARKDSGPAPSTVPCLPGALRMGRRAVGVEDGGWYIFSGRS